MIMFYTLFSVFATQNSKDKNSVLIGHTIYRKLGLGNRLRCIAAPSVLNVLLETNFSSEVYYEIIHDTLQQIDLIHRLADIFPQHLTLVNSVDSAQKSFKDDPNRIFSLMGVEGLHQIGNSASSLRLYHKLGVRYVTLTHDCNNKYADAALAPFSVHHGLSLAGKEMIQEMNRLGMIIDLAHTSDDTMRDTLAASRAPVIFSHSNARSVCNHVRNVPDDILLDLRDNGGVIMVTFYSEYTNCQNSSEASIWDVVDPILYIGRLIGFKHVGIGSDFDGMSHGPKGLEDVSKYPDLIVELLRSRVFKLEIEGIIGNNILRAWKEVRKVARELKSLKPLEDEVKEMPHLNYK
jgi:membrane dipeptidase